MRRVPGGVHVDDDAPNALPQPALVPLKHRQAERLTRRPHLTFVEGVLEPEMVGCDASSLPTPASAQQQLVGGVTLSARRH